MNLDARINYRVRIARAPGDFPHSVGLILPYISGAKTPPDQRKLDHFYLEDLVPSALDHLTVLGHFVTEWGQVELALKTMFFELAGLDFARGLVVSDSMGTKQIIDMVNSLATRRLTEEGITATANMMERVSRLNTKRNILVHGHWCLEFFLWPWKGEVKGRGHFLRETTPPDGRVEERISDPRNQKDRVRYTFNVKRIGAAICDAQTLTTDLGRLADSLVSFARTKDGQQG